MSSSTPSKDAGSTPTNARPGWTIGWGHTAGVYEGMTITREQANEYLEADLRIFEDNLNFVLGLDDHNQMANGKHIN